VDARRAEIGPLRAGAAAVLAGAGSGGGLICLVLFGITAGTPGGEAYVAAHVSRGWPGMLAVGDAALRAGRATGTPEVFEPRARRAYLTALLRARRQASRDGVLAAGEAFGRLGDRDAERLAKSEAAKLAIRAEADARRRARAL